MCFSISQLLSGMAARRWPQSQIQSCQRQHQMPQASTASTARAHGLLGASHIASWIPTLQGNYKHNLSHIGYMLYTNWAAIDMFRHFDWMASATFKAVDFTGTNDASLELSIAVFAVVCVGLVHGFMQSVVCVWRMQRETSNEVKLLIQRRFFILLLGSLMPAWVGMFVVVVWGKRLQLRILGHWTTDFKWALWCLANWIGWNIGDILSSSWYFFPLHISFMGVTWVSLMCSCSDCQSLTVLDRATRHATLYLAELGHFGTGIRHLLCSWRCSGSCISICQRFGK